MLQVLPTCYYLTTVLLRACEGNEASGCTSRCTASARPHQAPPQQRHPEVGPRLQRAVARPIERPREQRVPPTHQRLPAGLPRGSAVRCCALLYRGRASACRTQTRCVPCACCACAVRMPCACRARVRRVPVGRRQHGPSVHAHPAHPCTIVTSRRSTRGQGQGQG